MAKWGEISSMSVGARNWKVMLAPDCRRTVGGVKDRWTGERKYALRVIVKHLKGEQDAVDTPTDSDERRV
jgi:hypothetical protein